MKTKLLVTLIVLHATAIIALAQARPDPWAIKGKVVTAKTDGALVIILDDGSVGRAKPPANSVIYVRGLIAADDEPVNISAFPDGYYDYTAVSGAAKRVRAFRMQK